jgi:hypothetical protein
VQALLPDGQKKGIPARCRRCISPVIGKELHRFADLFKVPEMKKIIKLMMHIYAVLLYEVS